MNKSHLILVALVLLFAGCATTRQGEQPQFAPLNLQQATIYLYDNMTGIVIGPRERVVVNGVPIATLGRRQYTWFFAPPGVLDISLEDPGQPGRVLAANRFIVERGKAYHIAYQLIRFAEVEVPDGKTFDPEPIRERTFRARQLVTIRESDGIAMTQTHRLVDNSAPWNPIGPGYYMRRREHREIEIRRRIIDYKE